MYNTNNNEKDSHYIGIFLKYYLSFSKFSSSYVMTIILY